MIRRIGRGATRVAVVIAGLAVGSWSLPDATASPEGALEIEVIDATRGAPVADADIVVSAEGDSVPDDLRAPWSRLLRTDAKGRVTVEGAAAATAVRAQVSSAAAGRALRAESGTTTVFLAPAGSIVVQTLDSDGNPVPDVPLTRSQPDWNRTPPSATRGPLALAVLPQASVRPTSRRETVSADLGFATPVEASFDVAAEVPTLVRLRLPPCPSLDVEVAGLAPGEVATVTWRIARRWVDDETRKLLPTTTVEGGRASFRVVPPGGTLVVEARCESPLRPIARALVKVPKEGTAPVRTSVRIGKDRATLVGRVVGSGGTPTPGVIVWAEPDAVDTIVLQVNRPAAVTDAAGRFRIELEDDADVLAPGRVIVSVLRGTSRQPGEPVRVAALPLRERRRDGGEFDVGDVSDAESLVAAAGVVRDEAGVPVGEASVWLRRRSGAAWKYVRGAVAKSGADGAFWIRAVPPEGELGLSADAEGWVLDATVPVQRGQRDAVVVMKKAAAMEVRAAVPEGTPAGTFEVRISGDAARLESAGPGTSDVRRIAMSTARDGDRVFTDSRLRPGRARIETTWHGVRIGDAFDVDLRAGEHWTCPVRIDVASLVTTRVVTVWSSAGEPVPGARLWTRPARVRGRWIESRVDSKGRSAVAFPDAPMEVFAIGAGAGGETSVGVVAALAGDGEVVLTRRTAKRVEVHIDATVPDDANVTFTAGLAWIGPPGTVYGESSSLTEAPGVSPVRIVSGTGTLTVFEPGVYAVTVGASASSRGTGSGGSFTAFLHSGPVTCIDVPTDATEPIRVVHRPAAEEVAEVIASAREL